MKQWSKGNDSLITLLYNHQRFLIDNEPFKQKKATKKIEWRIAARRKKRCEQAVLYLTQGKNQVMEGNKAAYLWHKTNWIAFGGMEIEKTWMNACTHINKNTQQTLRADATRHSNWVNGVRSQPLSSEMLQLCLNCLRFSHKEFSTFSIFCGAPP